MVYVDKELSEGNTDNNKPQKITIILADDHPLMREALSITLKKQADFEVIAEASNGEEAIRLTTLLNPDVLILDISMPKLNGIEATKQVKAQCPRTAVLAFTVHSDYERILRIFTAGANGYLTKAATGGEIVEAVRGVVSGESILSAQVSQELIKYAIRNNTQLVSINSVDKLNHKEIEILKLIAKGKANKYIAKELNLSLPTVKTYVADVFSKLNVGSRTEAAIMGLRMGFLDISDIQDS
jgi:DNA-binding NarL/FixJ family response regulator